MIEAKLVAELREQSGAPMMDAKKALEEANGDLEKASELLRKRGLAKALKKAAERNASEGLIASYIHANGKVGVLIEVSCETDFVARNETFQELTHDLSLHIAALDPWYLRREEIAPEIIDRERRIALEELISSSKPPEIVEKIIQGKLEKFFFEHCLLEQLFVKDENLRVTDLIASISAKLGEKIEVRRFVRYAIAT